MTIYSETNTIIKAVEYHLVSETETTVPHNELIWLEKLIDYFQRIFLLPPKFLTIGIKEKLRATNTWANLAFVLMALLTFFLTKSGIQKVQTFNVNLINLILIVSFVVPLFLVIFSLPSIYGHSGVSQESVDFVVKHLQKRGFTHAKDIELLKKSVKVFEDRCRARVNALKWLVGLLWASFIYMYSKGLEHTITPPTELLSYLITSVLLFLAVVFGYFGVWGYDAALDKLFRTIEFGCNDFCYHIEETPSDKA